ncbi:MAG: class I SAM-dependent methyltransferase [Solirubrobacteraceae bacterium]|nr:class I SAM-dependent methyltransferase [Solirubrobacteraceae bacterium]
MTDPDSWWLDERAYAGREHSDEQHTRRYDAKMDAGAPAEIRLLEEAGVLGPDSTVVDLGTGTGQFALAAAAVCARVVAVDVAPLMLARLREKLDSSTLSNVEVVSAGFLTYEHVGGPADVVYSRFALHHLPDFWQAIALRRMAEMLRPGGVLRLSDVVYSFEPEDAERRIEAWIAETMAADVDGGWTRAELAEHVRDEHSTFTWLLEPMIERAGFDLADATYDDSGMLAQYLCRRR